MKKVFILNANFYDYEGNEITVGGVQTYIKMLVDVIKKLNRIPVIYQYANKDFINYYEGIKVVGVKLNMNWKANKKNQMLFDKSSREIDSERDVIIFASDIIGVKTEKYNTIAIQHGISWDVKNHENYSHTKNMLFIFWRAINALKIAKRMRWFKVLVAVDYNFLNWYRTQVAYIETDVKVIPNCTQIKPVNKEKTECTNIIFARRFYHYRGTRIFAAAIKNILERYKNISVTFAGSGPDEKYLKELFKDYQNVYFTKYESNRSHDIHQKFDIAVVPTIGSEGTSLSLLEAMAAECAVIATNVGGMTNIILDRYNGLMVNPDEKELYKAIEELIIDRKLRKKLSQNAHKTVHETFNKSLWEKKWIEVIEEISQ